MMTSDLESLEDLLQPPTNTVRAVGKFHPKAKYRPKNENPLPPVNPDTNATQSTFPTLLPYDSIAKRPHSTATMDPSSKLHENQEPGNCEVIGLDALVAVDLGDLTKDLGRSTMNVSAEPLDDPLSQDIVFRGSLTGERSAEPQVDPLSEATAALNNGDLMTGGRSSREAADMLTNFESIHDVLFQSTCLISVELVSPLTNAASSGTLDERLNHPAIPPSSAAPMGASSQYSEIAFFNAKVDSQMDHVKVDVTAHSCLDSLDDIEFCEPPLPPAKGSGKFRPKLKAGAASGKSSSLATLPDIVEPIPQQESQLHLLEIESLEDDSILFPSNPFASSMQHCDYLQGEALPSLPVSQPCSAKLKPSKGKLPSTAKETMDNALSKEPREVAATLEGNEGDKSPMKLRKRIARHGSVNEIEGWTDGTSNAYTPDENCLNDEEYRGEEETSKQKHPRKLRNLTVKNEMQDRGHKKASEGAYSVNEEPLKKKFRHSTRRNRRLVNKELLETPEEEIDPRKLIMKDLILLAETKERKMTNEAATLNKPFTNLSDSYPGNTNTPFDENDPFDSTRRLNPEIDDEATLRVEPRCQKLNYHSFMLKTSKERWSPSDTKLFYEAIRQFGTDFAMIQQLFPGRSHHTIKLKYKAEERKHPMQVADALMHRSKDHSHFELVIERLQTQTEQTSNRDLQVPSPIGENEEEAGEVTKFGKEEDIMKPERKEEVLKNRKNLVPSPDKLQEVQEVYDWSNYRSDDTEKDVGDGYDWGDYRSDNVVKEIEDTYDWGNYRSANNSYSQEEKEKFDYGIL